MTTHWLRPGWRSRSVTARPDAELARLTAQVEALQAELAGLRAKRSDVAEPRLTPASFKDRLSVLRRMSQEPDVHDPETVHPFRQLPFKLRTQRLAESHGVATPEVFDVWPDLDQVNLEQLPDGFVLKSDRGAGGKGVLAMQRMGPDRYRVVGRPGPWTAQRALDHLRTVAATGKIDGPYFAEQLLRTPQGEPVTDDIKIYSFYGEVGQVLLRRLADPTDPSTIRNRYVSAGGADLRAVRSERAISTQIPVPDSLPQAVRIAEHLSRAVGLPFCRVDVYDTDAGVILGEITRAPGGPQQYRPAHDEQLGLAWDRARWRLERDLAMGRPFGIIHGDRPAPSRYPAGHPSHEADHTVWNRPVLPCRVWCGSEGRSGP